MGIGSVGMGTDVREGEAMTITIDGTEYRRDERWGRWAWGPSGEWVPSHWSATIDEVVRLRVALAECKGDKSGE